MSLSEKALGIKTLLGVASFLPALASLGTIIFVMMAVGSADPDRVASLLGTIVAILFISLIGGFALAALFATDAYRDNRLNSDGRALWLVFLIAVPPISVPAYWLTRVRRSR